MNNESSMTRGLFQGLLSFIEGINDLHIYNTCSPGQCTNKCTGYEAIYEDKQLRPDLFHL